MRKKSLTILKIAFISFSEVPMEIFHIDHFGPLQETEIKYKYILVIVDAFMRFTWLCATKTTRAKESINHLQTIFDIFGKPEKIVSDRGTAFTAKKFTDFTNMHNIKHRKVAVAASWVNGLVERINRFLKSSLTKVATTPDDWKNKLGMIQYIINNTFHSAIKSSPSKLMLDYERRYHEDFSFSQHARELTNIEINLKKEGIKRYSAKSIKLNSKV